MKPYSEDLRTRIVRAVEEDMSKSAAARLFGGSHSSVKRYAWRAERSESLTPRKGGGRPPKADETTTKPLEDDVEKCPAATIPDRCRFLRSATGKSLSTSTVRRLLKRLGFSQKTEWGEMERDEWLRAAWRVMVAKKVEPERLVFVGEMGANTSLSVMRAWSRTGERAYCSVPRNRGRNTTLLASMAASGMGPTLAVEGATNREVFEAYVEEVLTQSLRRSCSPIEKTQPWLTPVGGLAHGWKQVAETMERAASSRRDSETVGFEIEVKHVTPELAYMWR